MTELLMQPCMNCGRTTILYPDGFYTGYCAWCIAEADKGFVLKNLSSWEWRRQYPVFHREWRKLGEGTDEGCEFPGCLDYGWGPQYCWGHSRRKCPAEAAPGRQCSNDREDTGVCAGHFEDALMELVGGDQS